MVKIKVIYPSLESLSHQNRNSNRIAATSTFTTSSVPSPSEPRKPRSNRKINERMIMKPESDSEGVRRKKKETLENLLFDHEPGKVLGVKKMKVGYQVRREKVARLKYSRDYSFLSPVDEKTEGNSSPPLKGLIEDSKQSGVFSNHMCSVDHEPAKVLGVKKTKVGSQVRREKVARLQYDRDYSFLFPVDEKIESNSSPPLKGLTEDSKQSGVFSNLLFSDDHEPAQVVGVKKTKVGSQVQREKVARLEDSRDYSFLFPVDEKTEGNSSPPLKGLIEDSRQSGGKISSQARVQETKCTGVQGTGSAMKVVGLGDKKMVRTQLGSEKEVSKQNIHTSCQMGLGETAVTGVKSNKQHGAAVKVEGLNQNNKVNIRLGSQKTAEEGERKRLVLRWRITPDGKGKIIKNSNLDRSCSLAHHGPNSAGKLDEKTLSFITEIFKTIFKVESLSPKNARKGDVKAIRSEEESLRQRFKTYKPRWKPICRPKISLGAPRLSSPYVARRKDGAF